MNFSVAFKFDNMLLLSLQLKYYEIIASDQNTKVDPKKQYDFYITLSEVSLFHWPLEKFLMQETLYLST